MSIGPVRDAGAYPFSRLDDAKQTAARNGVELIDFGMGDPREETPLFIREAVADAIDPVSSYPRAGGVPELREAIAGWAQQRFGCTIAPDDVMPTMGAKEIIHSLAAYRVGRRRNVVVVPDPAYPVYDRGARFHGAEVLTLDLRAERGFLPDLSSISSETWERVAILWLNYPNNPTGACAPFALYEQAAALARRYGFLLASDEAYSELYFAESPFSALQLDDLRNVVVINTLSKRSCMTGFRSGFIAGDPEVIADLRRYRPSVGVTPQDFVQRASVAAWSDESHVQELRARWAAKRSVMIAALRDCKLEAGTDATFFLWGRVPAGFTSEGFATRLLEDGIVVAPGSFFGPAGEGFFRLALVPSLEDCHRAADRFRNITWEVR